MDQGVPDSDAADEPRTELQKRVDGGEAPRTILDELYRRMQARLHRDVRKSVGAHDAEDIVARVFLKMCDNFERMIKREPVEAWIFTVANNEVNDFYRRRPKSAILTESDDLERTSASEAVTGRSGGTFEERVETWVGGVEPLLIYLRALVAKGSLSDIHVLVFKHGLVEEMTQQELAVQLERTQGRISQLRLELRHWLGAAMYLCEILGLVTAPHREDEIRSHLDLFDRAERLTADDRALLRRAGAKVRLNAVDQPVLLPEAAEVAIQPRQAGRVVTLNELHDAESRYAAAIPNPTPHCIESPRCHTHGSPYMTGSDDDE